MSSKKVIIQTVLFAILGAVLLYFSFDKINISELVAVLKKGDYTVVLPVFLVSLLVYVSRVKRWQILCKAADKDVPANFLFASLASGYLVNFVVPRLGEITRAAVLKKWQNIPMNLSLPTVVFERIIDLLCLLIILVAAFVLEVQLEGSLLNEFTKGVSFVNAQKLYMLAALLPLGIIFYFWIKKREDKLSKWIQEFIGVFSQLIKMPKLGWFIFHTIIIWLGFFLMTYIWFYLFEESRSLSIYQAYLVMVLGVIARTLPIQAGSAGAYHFIVSKALIILGVGSLIANALAIIIHGFQTIFTIVFGALAYIWLLGKNRVQE